MFTQVQRQRIVTTIALAAAGITAGLPVTSLAQEQNLQIEEIVVTAQKREQSLQDVSMSLSAFTGVALEERLIEDLSDLQFSVPNLLVRQQPGHHPRCRSERHIQYRRGRARIPR